MAAVARELSNVPASDASLNAMRVLVLARLVCGDGATRAELAKDLAPLTSHRFSPAELRRAIDAELAGFVAQTLATESRNQIVLTATGMEVAQSAVSIKSSAKSRPLSWQQMRDIRLVAVALGGGGDTASRLQNLSRPDGLRAAILQKAFGMSFKGSPTPARLRGALAVVALERAFGNKIKSGFGAGDGLSAKAGRLLASQLSAKPRDFGTDSRLIAALAAEQVGSHQSDADALRAAVLRGFAAKSATGPASAEPMATTVVPSVVQRAPVASVPPTPAATPRPAAASRPDLKGFAAQVQIAARGRAEGWPGNRKAYISDVWQVLSDRRPEWGLTEIEFKGMLAEAHRTGFIVLANADLKDRQTIGRVQKSAITFKNTVLHFVRVED